MRDESAEAVANGGIRSPTPTNHPSNLAPEPPPPGVWPPAMIGNEDDSRQFGNRLRSKDAANKLLPGEIDDEDGRGQSSSEPYKPVGECSGEQEPSRCTSKETAGSERRFQRTNTRTSHRSGKSGRTSVFDAGEDFNAEDVKDTIRKTLEPDQKPYDVEMLYWKDGLWRKIATHEIFLNGTLAVISINALWMSVDTNYNDATSLLTAHPVFQIAEQMFCIYFSFEWFVRFMSFERKLDGRKDGWFVFDSILVALMLMETWGLSCIEAFSENKATLPFPASVLRLFRLLRLSRLMRMLRSLPELMILIKGMVTALKSVFYVLLLLILFLYVFGIAFKQLSVPYEFHEAFFESIPLAMYSLFIYGTFLDDLAYFCDSIRFESPECFLLSLVFIMLGSMTVMNMLVGVLCEVVGTVAIEEREDMAAEKASASLKQIVDDLDTDSNGKISHNEFRAIIDFKEALISLEEIDVDPVRICDFAEHFFVDKEGEVVELEFDDFMAMVLKLRSSNKATVADMKGVWKNTSPKFQEYERDVTKLSEALNLMLKNIQDTKAKKLAMEKKLDQVLQTLEKLKKAKSA